MRVAVVLRLHQRTSRGRASYATFGTVTPDTGRSPRGSRTVPLVWNTKNTSSSRSFVSGTTASITSTTSLPWKNLSRELKAFSTTADQNKKSSENGGTDAKQRKSSLRYKSTSAAAPSTVSATEDKKEETKEVVTARPTESKFAFDLGLPKLVPEWKRMFQSSTLFTDVSAGITVGCIAVPLSLAIAVASGVPAEVGLVTAAVSGIAGGLMGGTTLAVTGPAAAISLLVIGAVQEHGLEALPFITLACGGLQFASGVTRLGTYAKLVPVSVIAGFTTGVGTLILSGQLPKALGMTAPPGLNPVEIMGFIGQHASQISPESAALALGTSAAMWGLPKLHAKMPSALLAVGGATLATHTLGFDVSLIGSIPSGLSAFSFGVPMLPSLDSLPSLTATVLLIYGMTSVESLLSCAALEKMKKTDYKYNPDQELVGQGIANIGSSLFMGMPVTSVIARSSLNVRLNASTRLPALVQAGFVFGSVVFFSDSIAMIPMPALSGVLITTGMGMLNPAEIKHCYSVQKSDLIPFGTTIGGMITMGLAEGISIGCVSAALLNYGTARQAASAVPLPTTGSDATVTTAKLQVREVGAANGADWQLQGPINFFAMFQIDDMIKRIEDTTPAADDDASNTTPIVVDMAGVTTVEFTGVEELVNRLKEAASYHSYENPRPIRMIHASPAVQNAVTQCDATKTIVVEA